VTQFTFNVFQAEISGSSIYICKGSFSKFSKFVFSAEVLMELKILLDDLPIQFKCRMSRNGPEFIFLTECLFNALTTAENKLEKEESHVHFSFLR